MTRGQVIELANSYAPAEHIFGTAKFISELKDASAGNFWQHEFQFTSTSYITEFDKQLLLNTGAVVLYTDLRTLVLYKNDVFNNAPMVISIKSNNEISEISFTQNSLNVL